VDKGSPAPRRPVSPMTKEGQPESTPEATKPKASVTYQVSERPASRVQEEEFAKQLRLARYLSRGQLGRSHEVETVTNRAQSVTKPKPRAKEPGNKKGVEAELAKERRRAGRISRRKAPPSGQHRDERQRSSPGR
jgi:hypothetical protein